MDPLSIIALAGLGANIVGGLTSLFGDNKQADEEQRRLRLQARYADRLAGEKREQGNYEAGRIATSGSAQAAEVHQDLALGGFNPDTGTGAVTQAHIAKIAEFEATTTQNNAARAARGYENKAWELRDQAKKIGQAQVKKNIGAGLGIAASAATAVFGLQSQFHIFGGGLPDPNGLTGLQRVKSGLADSLHQAVADGAPMPESSEQSRKIFNEFWGA